MKKAALHNLGCKVNTYELDAMIELLVKDGYEIVPFEEKADIYIINTCTVTNIADRKSRQMLHKARKMNPEAIVIAVGCYVQARGEEILKEEGIDLCIGNNHKGEIVSIINDYLINNKKETGFVVSDLLNKSDYENIFITETSEHSRAFLKIQDGCNQFCSYCIIPFARGRVRSRKEEDILNEIKKLVSNGYKEFVLTGIHLSSYGTDFDYDDVKADRFGPERLLHLFEEIDRIEGVKRIRLGSLEPRIITEDFCERLSKIKSICPHFHLSLQSGSDNTLKRMNRHYSADEFYKNVCIIRKYFEHPAITTDIIVGFPGETKEDFNECREFVQKIKFFETHIFKYSRRKGTIADKMDNQLTDAVKSERSDELEAIEKIHSKEFRDYYLGKEVEVLFEEKKEIDGNSYYVGHTKEYVKVIYSPEDGEMLENELKTVRIEKAVNGEYYLGVNLWYARCHKHRKNGVFMV